MLCPKSLSISRTHIKKTTRTIKFIKKYDYFFFPIKKEYAKCRDYISSNFCDKKKKNKKKDSFVMRYFRYLVNGHCSGFLAHALAFRSPSLISYSSSLFFVNSLSLSFSFPRTPHPTVLNSHPASAVTIVLTGNIAQLLFARSFHTVARRTHANTMRDSERCGKYG